MDKCMHAHGANAARSGHTLACGIGRRRLFFAFAFSNNTVQQCDKTTTTENSACSVIMILTSRHHYVGEHGIRYRLNLQDGCLAVHFAFYKTQCLQKKAAL